MKEYCVPTLSTMSGIAILCEMTGEVNRSVESPSRLEL